MAVLQPGSVQWLRDQLAGEPDNWELRRQLGRKYESMGRTLMAQGQFWMSNLRKHARRFALYKGHPDGAYFAKESHASGEPQYYHISDCVVNNVYDRMFDRCPVTGEFWTEYKGYSRDGRWNNYLYGHDMLNTEILLAAALWNLNENPITAARAAKELCGDIIPNMYHISLNGEPCGPNDLVTGDCVFMLRRFNWPPGKYRILIS